MRFLSSLNKRDKLLLGILLLCTSACLLSLLIPQAQLSDLYHASGFYLLFASFVYWAYLSLPRRFSNTVLLLFIRQHGWVLLLFVAVVALMFLASPIQFRVLADETNLLGVANSMYQEHSFANRTSALYYFNQQHKLDSEWGIRPNFFPFLIYVMHSLKGYSAYNGFIVNAIAAVTCLWTFYWLLSRFFQTSLAILGAITLAAFPVFVLWATSSGFEIVNLALALTAFCWFYQYQRHQDGYHLERLALTLVLLAQTRYESAVFVFSLGLSIVLMLRVQDLSKISFRILLAPFFFLPIAWQRFIKTDKSDYQVIGEDALFSIDYWLKHIELAWLYFTTDKELYGTISIIFYLAIAGLVFAVAQLAYRRKALEAPTKAVLIASALTIAALIAVIFSYFWGNLIAAFTIRLGIIFLPFIIALAIYALERIISTTSLKRENSTKFFLIIGFCLCLFYWPIAGKNEATQTLTLNRQYQTLLTYLQEHHQTKNILIVTDRPGMYSVHHWGAVDFNYANKNYARIKRDFDRRLYQDVLVLQLIDYASGGAIKGTRLTADFSMEVVFEAQFNATAKMRISRLK